MAFIVVVHYKADPDQQGRVESALRHMIEPSRAEPGNLAYEVAADPADPAAFTIFEKYTDEAAFQAHAATPHFETWLKGEVLPNLAERTRHDLTSLEPS